jgi:hypothetical protein
VPTKALNQSVKGNIKRFPEDFMFRLKATEWRTMGSQFVTASQNNEMRSQIVTALQSKRNTDTPPYAFTEQGMAMLSGTLNSDIAINMNIAIMRAFVSVRKLIIQPMDVKAQLIEIKERLGEHDAQLNQIYEALENLLDERIAQKKWEDRERIGFKKYDHRSVLAKLRMWSQFVTT